MLPAFSQVDTMRYGGIRVGVDVVPLVGYFLSPKQTGAAFTVDAEFRDGWFIVAEGGFMNFKKTEVDYSYSNNGRYLKIGVNHNFIARKPNQNDIAFWGLRLATGSFTHAANPITIRSGYWGDYVTSVGAEQIHPFWTEITAGIKVEMFKNFFLGWNVRGRFFLQLPKESLAPFIVPGYGYAGKSFSIGFNYTLSYRIPYKIKVRTKKKKKKTEEEEEK